VRLFFLSLFPSGSCRRHGGLGKTPRFSRLFPFFFDAGYRQVCFLRVGFFRPSFRLPERDLVFLDSLLSCLLFRGNPLFLSVDQPPPNNFVTLTHSRFCLLIFYSSWFSSWELIPFFNASSPFLSLFFTSCSVPTVEV